MSYIIYAYSTGTILLSYESQVQVDVARCELEQKDQVTMYHTRMHIYTHTRRPTCYAYLVLGLHCTMALVCIAQVASFINPLTPAMKFFSQAHQTKSHFVLFTNLSRRVGALLVLHLFEFETTRRTEGLAKKV